MPASKDNQSINNNAINSNTNPGPTERQDKFEAKEELPNYNKDSGLPTNVETVTNIIVLSTAFAFKRMHNHLTQEKKAQAKIALLRNELVLESCQYRDIETEAAIRKLIIAQQPRDFSAAEQPSDADLYESPATEATKNTITRKIS